MLEWNTPFIEHIWLPMTSGFPALTCTLKAWRFEGITGLHKKVTALLKVIPKGEFHKSFWEYQHHYAKCTAFQGNYYEDEGNPVTPFIKRLCLQKYMQQLNSHTLYMTMIKVSPNTSNSNGFSLNDGICGLSQK